VGKILKRRGQVVIISTAGEFASEFEAVREKIRQAATQTERQGCFLRATSATTCLHEWAVPEDGDVDDLELVKAANPFSRVTVESLASKREDPIMTAEHWARLTCNLPSRARGAAITEAEWYGARTAEQIPPGIPIWIGLDVAWKHDTTAMVPFWPRDDHFRLLGAPTILIPPRDGNSLDPNQVERALIAIHQRNPIHTVVMDISKAEQLGSWIETTLGAKVIERGTTNKDAAFDYERFMEALRMGWLKHTGDQGLTSHVLNAIARITPEGKTRFERPVQSRWGHLQDLRVIDALTAAAMVHSVATASEPIQEFAAAWR